MICRYFLILFHILISIISSGCNNPTYLSIHNSAFANPNSHAISLEHKTEPQLKSARILLKDRVTTTTLTSDGNFTVVVYQHNKSIRQALLHFNQGKKIHFFAQGNYLVMKEWNYRIDRCWLIPEEDHFVHVDDRVYRGRVELRGQGDTISVINIVDIQEYLYGVLPAEVDHRWPLEALKAQAITARTYALFHMIRSEQNLYDLFSNELSQVYKGYSVEQPKCNRAVDETKNKVIVYKNQPIIAYFHSNSGGYTEAPENTWGVALPYLSIKRDEFSTYRRDKDAFWQKEMNLRQVSKILRLNGYKIKRIFDIIPSKVNKYGRIGEITIRGDRGSFSMSGNNFRLMLGTRGLKSTYITDIKHLGNKVLFIGKGSGHGVGMSQWGAYNMAALGFKAEDIIHFYYDNVSITTLENADLAYSR